MYVTAKYTMDSLYDGIVGSVSPQTAYRVELVPRADSSSISRILGHLAVNGSDVFLWPRMMSVSQLAGECLSLPVGWSLEDMVSVWNVLVSIIVAYVARVATYEGGRKGVGIGLGQVSLTLSRAHSRILAAQELTEYWTSRGYVAVILQVLVPSTPHTSVPARVLAEQNMAGLTQCLIQIAYRVLSSPLGFVLIGDQFGPGNVSPSMEDSVRAIWDSSLRTHHAFQGSGCWSIPKIIVQEISYLWWHRETHVARHYLTSCTVELSHLSPLDSPSYAESQFGEAIPMMAIEDGEVGEAF